MSFGSRLSDIVNFVAGLAMIATCGTVLWLVLTNRPPGPEPPPKEPLSLSGVILKGDPSAKVGILEYGDVQCPACVSFETGTRAELLARFVDTRRVVFGFRHFPLPRHPRAEPAAIAAYCAGEQGKFWEMQSALFQGPARLEEGGLLGAVRELGLDEARWAACRASDTHSQTVRQDIEHARLINVRVTPTFFIGRILQDGRLQATAKLEGAGPLEAFADAIAQAERVARGSN